MKSLQLTLGALSIVGLLLTPACGKNKAVASAEDFATAACACKDAKCAMDASVAFAAKAEELKDATGSEADIKAITAAGEKATACIAKLAAADVPAVDAAAK